MDLNRETEGMKFGAVRDGNLLSALMIACDGHAGALSAAPKLRHHFQIPLRKYHKYQIDNELSRMMHNHPFVPPSRRMLGLGALLRALRPSAALAAAETLTSMRRPRTTFDNLIGIRWSGRL